MYVAESATKWLSAFQAMERSEGCRPERVVCPNLYDSDASLDITAVLPELPPVVASTCDKLLPIVKLRDRAASRVLVLPSIVSDVAYMSEQITRATSRSLLDYMFSRLIQVSGAVDYGWHTDAVVPNATPTNLLTVAGSAEASFFRVTDRQRAAQFAAGQNAQPTEAELERAETTTLAPETLMTFQSFFDLITPRHQDAHNITTSESPRKTYRLEAHVLNKKALAVFETLVMRVPGLHTYHPEEVQARWDAY